MKQDPNAKRIIKRELGESPALFDSIDTVIAHLQAIKAAHPDKDIYIDEQVVGYNSSDVYYRFTYDSMETHEEASYRTSIERMKAEEDRKKAEKEAKMKALQEKKFAIERQLRDL